MSIDRRLKKLEQSNGKYEPVEFVVELVDVDGSVEVVTMQGTHEQWLETKEGKQ